MAVCAIHTLRLHAPDTPYTDAQLASIFRLATAAFAEVAEPAAPHFRTCLALLETAAQVKCFLLAFDLDGGDALLLDLFSTVLDAVNPDSRALAEAPALELLAALLDETDESLPMPQPLLDAVLGPLLPGARDDNPARAALAAALLQRAHSAVQPHVQRFLTRLLEGARTDSEHAASCSDLILQVHRAAPQITLPVMPHIEPSLQVESEERRLEAVDLLGRLLTQAGAAGLLSDHPHLPGALLRRLGDKSPDVRRRVLAVCAPLAGSWGTEEGRRAVANAVATRLQDPDERLRAAAAAALCAIAAEHPSAVRARHFEALVNRLRDRRLPVRKEVAGQVARLVRAWCLRLEEAAAAAPPGAPPPDGGAASGLPRRQAVVELAVGLCNLACTRDAEVAAHIMEVVFRGGVFPARLPPAAAAAWWGAMWAVAGGAGGGSLRTLLRGKYSLQAAVQKVLALRAAARALPGGAPGSPGDGGGADAGAAGKLEASLAALAATLHSVHRAEEGVTKLFSMKDNHIFRGLATLAAFGTPLAAAAEAAKDVQQRVGGRGPAADVAAALTARLLPNLVTPEALGGALEAAGDSPEAQALVLDVAAVSPQLFAQSLPAVAAAFELDDPLAAECAARVLGAAGAMMRRAGGGAPPPPALRRRLLDMAAAGSPGAAKAAVRALGLLLGPEEAAAALRPLCASLLASLRRPATLGDHSRLLAALQAVSQAARMAPELLEEFGAQLNEAVMEELLPKDLSG